MNYPLQQLVYIAPILFLIMMVAFPIIGVFGGWKRAAYWGGGNFIFYIIGMLIWTFANKSMAGGVDDFIKGIIGGKIDGDFSKIAASVLAPIFFVGVIFVANIFLVINYYAWFKRVAGLSKYKTVKKTNKNGTVIKTKVMVQHNYSTKYKVMNMVVGGVGMGALMLPTTFAMTNALFFTTTSYRTRANSKFASKIYDATASTDYKIDWFSYYSNTTDSAADFDALFAALDMMNTKIHFKSPHSDKEKDTDIIGALSDTLNEGLGDIYQSIAYNNDEGTDVVKEAYRGLATSWNDLIKQAGILPLTMLFNSANAAQVFAQIVTASADAKDLALDHQKIEKYYKGDTSLFAQMIDLYYKGELEPKITKRIDVNQESYDHMVDALYKCYVFKDDDPAYQDPEVLKADQEIFHDRMDDLLFILFC